MLCVFFSLSYSETCATLAPLSRLHEAQSTEHMETGGAPTIHTKAVSLACILPCIPAPPLITRAFERPLSCLFLLPNLIASFGALLLLLLVIRYVPETKDFDEPPAGGNV